MSGPAPNASAVGFSGLQVAELAERTGVTPTTVRYYVRAGLLRPSRSPDNGYRYFSDSDRRRVEFIRKAQAVGLTIRDIKAILEVADLGELPCDDVRRRVADRLEEVRTKIVELQSTERRMRAALALWDTLELPGGEREGEVCPLIEQLELDEDFDEPVISGAAARS